MVRNRFLLDTHIFIWWMDSNKRLSKEVAVILSNPQNHIFVSVGSVWEIIIKKAARKLKVPKDIEGGIHASGFNLLPIEMAHVLRIDQLPHYHKDPFDRLLIAQAKEEQCVLITDDPKIKKYNITILN